MVISVVLIMYLSLLDSSSRKVCVRSRRQDLDSRFRNRVNIQGLPITTEGRYFIRVSQKERTSKKYKIITELPLDIKISYKLETKNIYLF